MLNRVLIIFCLITGFALQGFSQKKHQELYIIYVDNSLPTGDGLSGALIEDLVNAMDTVKDKKFLFYMSNGKKYQVTENKKTASDFLNSLGGKNTQFPDPGEDVDVLRQKLIGSVKNFKGEIHFLFYVTDKFVAGLQDKYSPLVGLFPKELAHLYSDGVSKVYVRVSYPKISFSRVNETEVKNILNFNGSQLEDPLVSYSLFKY